MKELDPHITQIFQKYLVGKHTAQELDVLLAHFGLPGESDNLKALIEQQFEKEKPSSIDEEELNDMVAEMEVNIQKAINPPVKIKRFKWWYVAASIFLIFSIGTFAYLYLRDINPNSTLVSKYGDDVLPGKNKAYITLSDGSHYDLKENAEGLTIKDGNIQYTDGSSIVSNVAVPSATIHTPNGGQYRLILADGTKVILNSASAFTYPTRFDTERREVTLDGEAYFEVAKNLNKPFIVKGTKQSIEVLGTKFNASFYKGDQTVTTLVEGKVRIDAENGQQAVLNPGDHAVYLNNKIIIEQVSAQDYISWINNQFVFNDSSLKDVFAQLERWYDIQIDFPKEVAQKRLYAEISRDTKLSEVLETLEEVAHLKFTISGRRVVVRN